MAEQVGNNQEISVRTDANIKDFAHPILRQHTIMASEPGTHLWDMDLRDAYKYLIKDHCIQGAVVLPAAVFSELALSGANQVFSGGYVLEEMAFKEALILSDEIELKTQMVFRPIMPGTVSCQFFSTLTRSEADGDDWRRFGRC